MRLETATAFKPLGGSGASSNQKHNTWASTDVTTKHLDTANDVADYDNGSAHGDNHVCDWLNCMTSQAAGRVCRETNTTRFVFMEAGGGGNRCMNYVYKYSRNQQRRLHTNILVKTNSKIRTGPSGVVGD
jgi:hypothetical protein